MAGAGDLPFVDLKAQYLRLTDAIDAPIARVLDPVHYGLVP